MRELFQKISRQFQREMLLHCRQPRQMIYSCLFFLMVLVLFPLTISAENTTLRLLAPGLIWIDVLFAFFLGSERLFQQDYEDGVIEQWLVSGYPLSLLIFAKILAHWMLNILPLILLCPLIAIFLGLNGHELLILIASLVLGTPAIFFLCALAASFSAGIKQKGLLMALILFPLTIPVMIFGSATLTAVIHGQAVSGYIALLLGISTLAVGLVPFAAAGVVGLCLSE